MSILEFKKEYKLSTNCIKFLYSEAKKDYNLENYNFTIFIDSDKYHGMKYDFIIDFINNRVHLINENILAKYNLFNKQDFY